MWLKKIRGIFLELEKFERYSNLKSVRKINLFSTVNFAKKMGNWEAEKEKYLKLEPEAKRKDCVKLQNIPTWKSLSESIKLPEPIEMKENCAINISKNDVLAEKISIFEGDITTLAIDAIVNAANSSLLGGGGVDGAIHKAAGPYLKEECRTLDGCGVGDAKITGGYMLPARYVIHTVGPKGEQTEKLKKCYRKSLENLVEKKLRTIAFPCISTGIYGYPNLPAAHAAAYQVRKYLEDNTEKIDRVIFCLFLDEDKKIYKGILQSYFPVSH